ncbi:hypothetical protein ABZ723_25790 [Streptomyces sp. NPDC006700]|uniref:hypothetical protein n=1 Tax=unclassified Streptomyces TaxID=2593676 RepID=UPI00340F47B8
MSLHIRALWRAQLRPAPGTLLAGAALAVLIAFAAPAPSAAAHPFGPPSTAEVGVQDSRLLLAWNTDKLDWVTLGQSLGVFDGRAAGSSPRLSFEQRLRQAPAVRAYLLQHIAVTQAGRPCRGTVVGDMKDFLAQGAQLSFACPAPVAEADVTISALTDLHPAYRTMLTSRGPAEPQQTLFTSARPTAHMRFTVSGGSVRRTVAVYSAGTLVAALAIGGWVFHRSRRRAAARAGGTTSPGHGAAAASPATQGGPGAEALTNDPGTGTRSSA